MGTNLNIYFSMAISGGRQKQPTGKDLIEHCKTLGHVLNGYIGKKNVNYRERKNFDIYSRNDAWIEQADIVIAEVSVHSFGVGIEIEKAINNKIPVLCLYDKIMLDENQISKMLTSCRSIKLVGYKTNADAKRIIDEFVKEHGFENAEVEVKTEEDALAVPGHPGCTYNDCRECHDVSCMVHQGFEP